MRKFFLLGALILVLFLTLTGSAAGQSYSFSVSESEAAFSVDDNGVVTIEYFYTFVNDPSGPLMEYIDVGMPYPGTYNLDNLSGTINGKQITHVAPSTVAKGSVEFGLGSNSIQPGTSGDVYIKLEGITDVLFTTKVDGKDYVSFNFSTNYFDGIHGTTPMTVSLILPPKITEDQPRYYPPKGGWAGTSDPTEIFYNKENRVVYRWYTDQADLSKPFRFGAAFPGAVVPTTVVSQPSIWDILGVSFNQIQPFLFFCCCAAGIIGFSIWGSINAKKRRMAYLPPKIAVEGHGIKRGLTAVEAAILMEQPLDKVLTMILFGLMKKGAARVITREPLEIEPSSPLPEGLYAYETGFLEAFQKKGKSERQKAIQDMIVGVIKSLTEKMKGFSRKETITYYEGIMAAAWQQVEAANTPEVRSQKYEEVMEWTMLDKQYDDHTREVFTTGPVFLPSWWWRFSPGTTAASTTASTISTSAPAAAPGVTISSGHEMLAPSLPHLPGADFAASIVGGVQSFASGVLGDVNAFTSGVTNRTNPVPVSTPSRGGGGGPRLGGSSGGGHSCACACACAGCACACAGGGR